VSTDPAFAHKAAEIVGLYLAPPDQARGHSHNYKRHGTSTLFAELS
jgi:hypothetical protein